MSLRSDSEESKPSIAHSLVINSKRAGRRHRLVLLMVVSGKAFIEKGAENLQLEPQKAVERLDGRLHELTGMRLEEETPLPCAKNVNCRR